MKIKLLELWEKNAISKNHQKYFSKCLKYVKGKKIIETLNREIVEIKTRKSAIQTVMKAVRARESCLF